MKFFHISAKKWTRDFLDPLRPPDPETRGYGEDTTPRLSVAPTVSQCLLATPGDETLFHIYQVLVEKPVFPTQTEGKRIWDMATTKEMWVVQSHMDRAEDGKIMVKYLGRVRRTPDTTLYLKIAIEHKGVSFDADQEESLWFMHGHGEWTPKFNDANDIKDIIAASSPL